MTTEKRMLYRKAYVELYEIIKFLPEEQKSKIPQIFIKNIYDNRDKDYSFTIDNSKGLFEQDYMVETKALLVKLYEKYLATESEKEFWDNYDRICFNMVENEKRKKYNPEHIFENTKTTNEDENNTNSEKLNTEIKELTVYEKENIISKIFNKLKKLIGNIFKI